MDHHPALEAALAKLPCALQHQWLGELDFVLALDLHGEDLITEAWLLANRRLVADPTDPFGQAWCAFITRLRDADA